VEFGRLGSGVTVFAKKKPFGRTRVSAGIEPLDDITPAALSRAFCDGCDGFACYD
jgi:hypothetical protein